MEREMGVANRLESLGSGSVENDDDDDAHGRCKRANTRRAENIVRWCSGNVKQKRKSSVTHDIACPKEGHVQRGHSFAFTNHHES